MSLEICSDSADLKKLKIDMVNHASKANKFSVPNPISTPVAVQVLRSLYSQVLTELGRFN